MADLDKWEVVIGLEVHVQLATASKAFSPSAVRYGASPNSLTDPVVLGLPGALPTFNERALAYAVKLGLATGCTIRPRSRFARKQYFYPDLPKGYQISQFDEPLCEHGAVEFLFEGKPHKVALTRIHLEEDAGKSTHLPGGASLVDLNRAGVPLCEVVSEPDLRSAEEAAEYMRALRQLVRCLGISAGDMEKGNLRCDANVSLRLRGATELGTRAELKNINSFRFVQQAIEHEVRRQARILDEGGTIAQETRLWDADAGMSHSMRSKEEAEDYRYFPDPDLPPLIVDGALLAGIRATMPELPMQRHSRYTTDWGLSADDARTLADDQDLASFFDDAVAAYAASASASDPGDASVRRRGARPIANWMLGELLGRLNREGVSLPACAVTPRHLAELVHLIEADTISGKIAKKVFAELFKTGDPPGLIVERQGLTQITDPAAIENMARPIVEANASQAQAYRDGKSSLLGFFVGQVMKQSRGKANPQVVNEVLKRLLGE